MAEQTAAKTAPARRAGKTAAQEAAAQEAAAKEPTIWERLAADFPQEDLERLPRNLRKNDDNKGRCEDTNQGRYYSADGFYCHGYHARSVHLDYVGHAGITTRLNDVLGPGGWDFQPFALTPEGLPAVVRGEFWAKLTVTVPGEEPVTKWDVAANFNSTQEAVGDALRRCAMRFGVGTYLWSKSEAALAKKAATDDPPPAPERPVRGPSESASPPPVTKAPEPVTETTPVHVVQTYDILRTLTEGQKVKLAQWWDQAAAKGILPTRENMATITPDQAATVEDAVVAMLEAEQTAAQEAQDPQ